jgi:hypothetical protein
MSNQTHLRDPRWDEEQTALSDHGERAAAEEDDDQ